MSQRTLYILYNADGTILGKLLYGYRKLSNSGTESACSACDITHGGLSLSESPNWLTAKREIQSHGLNVVQWHRDEISSGLRDYIQANGVRYPAVILDTGGGEYRSILSSQELNGCAGDPKSLLRELRAKGVVDRSHGKGESSL